MASSSSQISSSSSVFGNSSTKSNSASSQGDWDSFDSELRTVYFLSTVDVPEDGHCFFHVLHLYFPDRSVQSIRSNFSEQLPKTMEDRKMSIDVFEGRTQKEYEDALKNNLWAGNLEMYLAADYFDCQIFLFSQNENGTILLQEILPFSKNPRRIVSIAYHNHHFRQVIPATSNPQAHSTCDAEKVLRYVSATCRIVSAETDDQPNQMHQRVGAVADGIARKTSNFLRTSGYVFTGPSRQGKSKLLEALLKANKLLTEDKGNSCADTQFATEIVVTKKVDENRFLKIEVVPNPQAEERWNTIRSRIADLILRGQKPSTSDRPDIREEEERIRRENAEAALQALRKTYPNLEINNQMLQNMCDPSFKGPAISLPPVQMIPVGRGHTYAAVSKYIGSILSQNSIYSRIAIDRVRITGSFLDSALPAGHYFDVPGEEGDENEQVNLIARMGVEDRKRARMRILEASRHAFIVFSNLGLDNSSTISNCIASLKEIAQVPRFCTGKAINFVITGYVTNTMKEDLQEYINSLNCDPNEDYCAPSLETLKKDFSPPERPLRGIYEKIFLGDNEGLKSLWTINQCESSVLFHDIGLTPNYQKILERELQSLPIARLCSPPSEQIHQFHTTLHSELKELCNFLLLEPTADKLQCPPPPYPEVILPPHPFEGIPNPYDQYGYLRQKAYENIQMHKHHASVRALANKDGTHSGVFGSSNFTEDLINLINHWEINSIVLNFLRAVRSNYQEHLNQTALSLRVQLKHHEQLARRISATDFAARFRNHGIEMLCSDLIQGAFHIARQVDPYFSRGYFSDLLLRDLESNWAIFTQRLQNLYTSIIQDFLTEVKKITAETYSLLFIRSWQEYPLSAIDPQSLTLFEKMYRCYLALSSAIDLTKQYCEIDSASETVNLALKNLTDDDLPLIFKTSYPQLSKIVLTGNLLTQQSLAFFNQKEKFPRLARVFLQFNQIETIPLDLDIPFTTTFTPQYRSEISLRPGPVASFAAERVAVVFETTQYGENPLPQINGKPLLNCLSFLKFRFYHLEKNRQSIELWDRPKWEEMKEWVMQTILSASQDIFFLFYFSGHSQSISGSSRMLLCSAGGDLIPVSELFELLANCHRNVKSLFVFDGCMGPISSLPTHITEVEQKFRDPKDSIFVSAPVGRLLPINDKYNPHLPTVFTQNIISALWKMVLNSSSLSYELLQIPEVSILQLTGPFGDVSLSLPSYTLNQVALLPHPMGQIPPSSPGLN